MEEKNLKFYSNDEAAKTTPTRLKYLREQVERLMQIPQPVQRSKEWYEFRNSMLTASDWATILGMNPYSNSNNILLKKCGKDVPFPSNPTIDWGIKYEDVAIKIYELRNSVEIIEFGCIGHPNISFLGASPDGISKDGVMLEIKCPSKREITGVIPKYYYCQVQGQLEVCELDRCDFLECNLKEYETKQDYLNDNYEGDYTKNNMGKEKGVVLDFFNNDIKKKCFVYSEIGIIGDELNEWIRENKAKYVEEHPECYFLGVSYWYLKEISCIPIYRNQEWFNGEALPKLQEFWDEIGYWRREGLEKLEEKLKSKKKPRKKLENVYIDMNLSDFMDTKPNTKKYLFSKVPDSTTYDEIDVELEENEEYRAKQPKIDFSKNLFSQS